MTSTSPLLTVPEVAELLCVSESWVRQRTRANEIRHVRIGGLIRYRAADIEQWVNDNLSEQ